MKKFNTAAIFSCLLAGCIIICRAERVEDSHARWLAAPPAGGDPRQYAPSREVDIEHLLLDITPDFDKRRISGKVVWRFRPIAKPLEQWRLDAVDLTIQSVNGSHAIKSFDAGADQLTITFARPIPTNETATVTILYEAEPSEGLYFRTPAMGYAPDETHLWTQGEPSESRHWYPGYDFPNEKFTSEVICEVPTGMTVLSNGKKMGEEPRNGRTAVRWLQDKPHVNYLITLVAGYFDKVEDDYRGIPLALYTPPRDVIYATNSFRDTKNMMAFYEQETGTPYPWAKYYQVCVRDYTWGGMENTTLTTLTDRTLFTTDTENIRSSQGLVAHELAHQWFGDLVTCKDWSHLWLNEGFATYYALLYDGHKDGPDQMLYGLYQDARAILDRTNDTKAVVSRKFASPLDQFSYLAYDKGSWVLHMLRAQLGPELFRQCIHTYLARHAYGSAITENLNLVIEELSGRSFDRFFDQWVFHAHHPELDVSYGWDEKRRSAKVTIKQSQKVSEDVLLFHFPLTIGFEQNGVQVEREIEVTQTSEDFYFPLAAAPNSVRIDPHYTLLAKIRFSPPAPLLQRQLTNGTDVIGRLLAVEQLATRNDSESINRLRERLNQDPFYGVRLEASKALRSIHSDDAFAALDASRNQSDARVRRQVLADLAGFYRTETLAAARAALAQEKNPDIVAQAIRTLGAYPSATVRDQLVGYLASHSFRETLADAAIAAIRRQSDPFYVPPLLRTLSLRTNELETSTLGRGLDALAFSARHEENRDNVREFILSFLRHPKKGVALAAIDALGTLDDPKAIPALETFVTAEKGNATRKAAEKALVELRNAERPSENLSGIRQELLDLQKANRDLRKEIDDLKKRTTETTPQVPPAKASEKKGKKPAAK